jgi:pentatricopeptide repeat protein
VTYNALITAAAQAREYDRAQELLGAMGRAGLPADEWTYNALLSVCERCGRWEEALDVFERMKAARVRPTTVTFNTLISACEKGWQWERAMKVSIFCSRVEISAPALDRRCRWSDVHFLCGGEEDASKRTLNVRHDMNEVSRRHQSEARVCLTGMCLCELVSRCLRR